MKAMMQNSSTRRNTAHGTGSHASAVSGRPCRTSSAQGLFGGLFWGVGFGTGAVAAGYVYRGHGFPFLFRWAGVLAGSVAALGTVGFLAGRKRERDGDDDPLLR